MKTRDFWLVGAAVLAFGLGPSIIATPAAAQIGISVSIGIPPPLIPYFAQPLIPGPGYIWTPGYWSWDPGCDCYYWVPGMWVLPPRIGWLWTPGYWYWRDGRYLFSRGYWGPRVGFYGGVDYGYGYSGVGYLGGEWRGGQFFYNRSVNNVGAGRVANTFSRPVASTAGRNRVSFNGGKGGLTARPTPEQTAAARAPHAQPTSAQTQRANSAAANPSLRASNVTKPGGARAVEAIEKGSPTHPGPAVGPVNPRRQGAPMARERGQTAPAGETGRQGRTRPPSAGPAPASAPNEVAGPTREARPSGRGEMRGYGVQGRPEGMRQTPPENRPETAPPGRSREPQSRAPESRPQGPPPNARQSRMQESNPPPSAPPQRDMMPGRQNQPPVHQRPSPDQSKPDRSRPDQPPPS